MAKQGAIRLVHGDATLLALGVVGFDQRDGDQAVVVTRHHLRARRMRDIRQEIEGQAMLRVLETGLQRQAEAQERVDQPMLRRLQPAPCGDIGRIVERRNGLVVPAGRAEAVGGAGGHQPVANVMRRVLAEQHGATLIGERAPLLAFRLERRQRRRLRDVAEAMTAALALGIFEIKDLATMLASKEFHPCRSVPRKSAGGAEWFRGPQSYERWLCEKPELMAALPELRGRDLCCWCAP